MLDRERNKGEVKSPLKINRLASTMSQGQAAKTTENPEWDEEDPRDVGGSVSSIPVVQPGDVLVKPSKLEVLWHQ